MAADSDQAAAQSHFLKELMQLDVADCESRLSTGHLACTKMLEWCKKRRQLFDQRRAELERERDIVNAESEEFTEALGEINAKQEKIQQLGHHTSNLIPALRLQSKGPASRRQLKAQKQEIATLIRDANLLMHSARKEIQRVHETVAREPISLDYEDLSEQAEKTDLRYQDFKDQVEKMEDNLTVLLSKNR